MQMNPIAVTTRPPIAGPNNYIEAQNWLKTSGRGSVDVYF